GWRPPRGRAGRRRSPPPGAALTNYLCPKRSNKRVSACIAAFLRVNGAADPSYNRRALSLTPHPAGRPDRNSMSKSYLAADIEVLSGLEPVRRRPGMYTDTQRPNHLAHEVIDNSVDEAIAGYAKRIEVNVYKDGSLEVIDDGRGMPVDIHPQE